jgi:uncharacterized protein YcgI (DUF1989 family)
LYSSWKLITSQNGSKNYSAYYIGGQILNPRKRTWPSCNRPPCNRWGYDQVLGQPGTTGCLENLRDALAAYGIEDGAVPDPFNIFMNTNINDKNEMAIEAPKSKAGDYIDLIAEMDCLVGATSCAEDVASYRPNRRNPLQPWRRR